MLGRNLELKIKMHFTGYKILCGTTKGQAILKVFVVVKINNIFFWVPMTCKLIEIYIFLQDTSRFILRVDKLVNFRQTRPRHIQ